MNKKKRTGRRVLSFLLTLAMVVGLLPGMGLTVYAALAPVSYKAATVDATTHAVTFSDAQCSDYTVVTSSTGEVIWNSGWYVVNSGTVDIDGSITVNGDVKLILCDDATLNAQAGITAEYEGTNSLTIYGQSENTGKLSAKTTEGGKDAIGNVALTVNGGIVEASATGNQSNGFNGNSVTVNGGTVTADGYEGIYIDDGCSMTVNGGNVTATASASGGDAIGSMGPVDVNGGSVMATSSANGSNGINSFSTVTIRGGMVNASGSQGINAYNLIISGGTVNASGGLGGGLQSSNDITINGGTVTAESSGDDAISAIQKVTFSGSARVTASTTGEFKSAVCSYSSDSNGGVYLSGTIGKTGANASSATEIETNGSGKVTSEIGQYLEITPPAHTHSFTYSASGATITATCNASDKETTCPLKDNSYKATLTIGTPTGEDGKAVLTANPSGSFDLNALQSKIKYSSKQNGTWTTASETAPNGDGIHRAEITLDEGNNKAKASVTYGRNAITYQSGTGGSVSGAASAIVGAKIELTVTPDANYTIDTLTIKGDDGQVVTRTGNAFIMPEKNVTVSATFKEIAYTVTVNGATATVKDNTPEQTTYTAELKVPSDKTYDGEPIDLAAANVEKSIGFPSQVTVGNISFKDQAGNAVAGNPTNVGTYTASVTVGDKTISKTFKIIGRTPSITYIKTTQSGNSYVITKTTTDQYLSLQDNPNGITLLDDGRIYVAEGTLTIGALIFKGNAKLILRKDSTVAVRAGIYHIGSTLELYTEEGGENAELNVKGDTALSGLTNYSDYSSQIAGTGATLSGTILIYGGKITFEKGSSTNLVADDIGLTVGAGMSAKGSADDSDFNELTGGTGNSDGSITYNKSCMTGLAKMILEYIVKPAAVSTAPVGKTLTYNGSAQALITAGSATGGTMQYAIGTDATSVPTTGWGISVPTGTDVGTYYVWYKATGDTNHTDSDAKCLTVTISKRGSSGGGGGSGSSGGGSYTPNKPTTPTTSTESYTVPVSNENTVNITTNISNNTAVVSEITQSDIDKIVDNGSSSGTGDTAGANENTSITIDVSQAKSEVTSVQLSEKTMEKLTEAVKTDNNVESVVIKMTNATVELDGAALSAVSNQAEGSNIKLVVENTQTTKLNATQQESLKQFASAKSFQAYFESNGKEIHDFKGGKATISIKFVPESGRDVKHYHMYYLPVVGTIERYITRYVDGMLSFVTTHFSDYAIVYDETMENETGQDTGTSDGSSETGGESEVNPDGTGNDSKSGNGSQTDGSSVKTANGKTTYQNSISINKGLKVSQTGSKINVSWGKVSGADRYEVYAAYCGKKIGKNPVKIITGGGVTSAVIRKLNGSKLNLKKNFKVYVVAYKTVEGTKQKLGKTVTAHIVGRKNTAYTNVKAIKLKKSKVTIKKGKTWMIMASVVLVNSSKKMLSDSHAPTFRYAYSNKKIATVDKNGKVTAKKKGSCFIWVYAKNGYAKKVKISVK